MLTSRFRSVAQTLRHAPGLRSCDALWNLVRPGYLRALNAFGSSMEVRVGNYPIQLSVRFAQRSWEAIEHAVYNVFAEAVRPGDVVYDIGAHIGTYSVLALQKSAPNGYLVAYEPEEVTRAFLEHHLRLNGVRDRAFVRPVCCGGEDGTASLYYHEGEVDGESGLLLARELPSKAVIVRTIDSEVVELGLVPTIIKIDVEGWEWEVLKGAAETLRRYRPLLFLSLHPRALATLGATAEDVQQWLTPFGYRHQVLGWDHELHVLATSDQVGAPHHRQVAP